MATKHWVNAALQALEESLAPVPHEVNELDWKVQLSSQKERLAEHLSAFANHPNGGCLVFGIRDDGMPVGVGAQETAGIVNTLANLGRDALEPPLAIDHSAQRIRGVPVLLVHVPEQPVKPVHRRGRPIEDAWIRSGGSTRKASRQEVGALMLNSATPRWEELRASPLIELAEVRRLLDLEAIAKLLQRPLPEDDEHLAAWLKDEGITVPDGRGHYITISAPRRFTDMAMTERIEAAYQHAVLQYVSSQTLTNTTLRTRFKLSEKHRNQITNLIGEAVDAGRIKRKDAGSGKKFAEYVPYWA